METRPTEIASSLRWGILRRALLPRSLSSNDEQFQRAMKCISRRTMQGFSLIPSQIVEDNATDHSRDARVCYTLPINGAPKLYLRQRVDNGADLNDFEICNRYDIDNTGLVCRWPSEDVLAYFCLSHADLFRSKRVIELGSGYGLAGLVIAASSEALEVTISDGNPQVVDYIQHNIDDNSEAFGDTIMKSMTLHWNQDLSNIYDHFDVIIASDCTFFKEFHKELARSVKSLLKKEEESEAIFMSPRRGDSLDKFLDQVKDCGLKFQVTEYYNELVWKLHHKFMNDESLWPGYDMDHCYPLLLKITL